MQYTNQCKFYMLDPDNGSYNVYISNPCDDLLQKLSKLHCIIFETDSKKEFCQFNHDNLDYSTYFTYVGDLLTYNHKTKLYICYQDFTDLMIEYGYEETDMTY